MTSDPSSIPPSLDQLLDEDPVTIRNQLNDVHPEDVADLIRSAPLEQAAEALGRLPTDYAAQVFERLEQDRQGEIAGTLGIEPLAQLTMEMSADERADFLSAVPDAMGRSLL